MYTCRKVIDAKLDRISCLPDLVVDQILSYLPIREAVRTSVLSSKWRYKWCTLPNLVFDRQSVSDASSQEPFVIESKFLKIVDHVLLVHFGPIDMFKFSHCGGLISESLVTDVDRWILHLTRRSVKELVLEVWIKDERYKIPWCLFSCQSLQHLQLYWCWLKPPSTFKGFKNLKSLDLNQVTVFQDAFENLISSCPLLEKLTLSEIDGLTEINIHAPNLKLFQVMGEFESISFHNTFQLTTVVVDLWVNYESNQSRMDGCSSNLLKFFDHQPHIQSLVIQEFSLKYLAAGVVPVKLPTPCINLRNLSLWINFDNLKEILAALCLLRSSPNLQKLEIFAQQIEEQVVPLASPSYCWEDIFSEPVMPIRVQHVTIDSISGFKSEIDFIRFLLLYSPVLEKMIVKLDVDVRPELVTELIRLKRASGEVEVIYHVEDSSE